MPVPATKNRLGTRLAVCHVVGTVTGLLIASVAGQLLGAPSSPVDGSFGRDVVVVTMVALALNVPLYAATILVLHNFTKSILAHPFVWCVTIPTLMLVAALLAFPPTQHGGVIWIAVVPLCALLAGLAFAGWQVKSPMVYIG